MKEQCNVSRPELATFPDGYFRVIEANGISSVVKKGNLDLVSYLALMKLA